MYRIEVATVDIQTKTKDFFNISKIAIKRFKIKIITINYSEFSFKFDTIAAFNIFSNEKSHLGKVFQRFHYEVITLCYVFEITCLYNGLKTTLYRI